MYSLGGEKIECALGNMEIWCWRGKKAENAVFYFLRRDSRYLFVSDSWYCKIQTTTYINHVLSTFILMEVIFYLRESEMPGSSVSHCLAREQPQPPQPQAREEEQPKVKTRSNIEDK